MLSQVHPPEIDHRTMKLIVGIIALSLANLTSFFANTKITSISASYYEGGWSQAIFIGFLFAIAAFLLAYNGYNRMQMVLSKIAAVAAACVALFPCDCDDQYPVRVKYVHGASAAVLFMILAVFCYIFFRRAATKGSRPAKARALIYAICGVVIVAVVLVLAGDDLSQQLSHRSIGSSVPRLTFYGEKIALLAFAVSWLAASHYLPAITTREEKQARRQRTA
jgi:predicted transporter